MSLFLRIVLITAAAAVVAGGVFLATWDIPPPTRQIEKDVPDERFPR
ncbi:MAG: hypothetical protein ACK4QW_17815 [Alphaproteobacteria bacterium]